MADKMKMLSMLFDYETTHRTDFRCGDIQEPILTTYRKRDTCKRIRPPPLKDVHTLSDWKSAAIPFSLLHTPKDIVRTNPTKLQQRFEKPIDQGRAEAQKTRPRLVMTPAVSMDDVADPRARAILCEDMYTTNTTRSTREAVSPYFKVEAPLPGVPSPANPVVLRKLQHPLVSPEWRMETVSWDDKQLRGYCDPNKEFWLSQEVPGCRACDETRVVEAHRRMHRQIQSNRR